jgi:hypothetical protein
MQQRDEVLNSLDSGTILPEFQNLGNYEGLVSWGTYKVA